MPNLSESIVQTDDPLTVQTNILRRATDAPNMLDDEERAPGVIYIEYLESWEQTEDPPPDDKVRTYQFATGSQYVFVDVVTLDDYNADPVLAAQTDAMLYVQSPSDFSYYRMRLRSTSDV